MYLNTCSCRQTNKINMLGDTVDNVVLELCHIKDIPKISVVRRGKKTQHVFSC